MNLTKSQKILHVIFRIIVFATFISACAAFVTFIIFGVACEDSYLSYSATLKRGLVACYSFYVLLGLSILSVIFSIICCKCTEVAATVTRTIFMVFASGVNFISLFTYNYIFDYAQAYLNGDFMSIYGTYSYAGSDAFESGVVLALLGVLFSGVIYFIFSITSIVALSKKPLPYNNYGFQQSPYVRPGMYNNPQGYPNPNMQGGYQNPQGYPNPNMQGGYQNPQGYPNPNMQGGYQNPQGCPNPNMPGNFQNGQGYRNMQGGYQNPQGYPNPSMPGNYQNPQDTVSQGASQLRTEHQSGPQGAAADIETQPSGAPSQPVDQTEQNRAYSTDTVQPDTAQPVFASKQRQDESGQPQPAQDEPETAAIQQESPVEKEDKKIIGYNPQTGEPIYEETEE